MRFSSIMKPVTKVAKTIGPFVSIAEGVSFVYDVATYKKRTERERRERDESIRKHVTQVYIQSEEARKTFIRNEVHELVKQELPGEVQAQLAVILVEKERREKEKRNNNGQNSK